MAFLAIGIALATRVGSIPSPLGYVLAAILFVVFVALVGYHEHLQAELLRLEMLKAYNGQRLARHARDWTAIPGFQPKLEYTRLDVARDLDLFNERSIVRLLSEAHTVQGQGELQRWLIEPANSAYTRKCAAAST